MTADVQPGGGGSPSGHLEHLRGHLQHLLEHLGGHLPAITVGWLVVVAVVLLVAPLAGLLSRTPWGDLLEVAGSPMVRDALALSLATATAAAVLATVLGVPLAWLLVRVSPPGARLLRSLALLPMVLPPVVAGVGLLLAFGRRGLLGGPLADVAGVTLPFSPAGVVLAQTFVALPFVVVTVEAALGALDEGYESAAATLGADRWTTLRRITLPLVLPGVGAGFALAFARALGEFGATITFAGNLPGRTQTMPLAVFLALERDVDAAVLLSVILLVVSLVVIVGLRRRVLGGG